MGRNRGWRRGWLDQPHVLHPTRRDLRCRWLVWQANGICGVDPIERIDAGPQCNQLPIGVGTESANERPVNIP